MFWHLKICKFLWYDKFSKSEVASPLKLRFTDSKRWCYTSIKAKGYINKLGLFRRLFKTMWGCFYYFFFLFIFFHSFLFILFTFILSLDWLSFDKTCGGNWVFFIFGIKRIQKRDLYQQLSTACNMSFRSIVRDVRDSIGSLSRRSFNVRLSGHHRGKSHASLNDLHDQSDVIQNSCWASLPAELLFDVIKRLEESESSWPARKHVVACAAVCRSWRAMCKEIVKSPEFCGKLTFPVSLKQVVPTASFILLFLLNSCGKLIFLIQTIKHLFFNRM